MDLKYFYTASMDVCDYRSPPPSNLNTSRAVQTTANRLDAGCERRPRGSGAVALGGGWGGPPPNHEGRVAGV